MELREAAEELEMEASREQAAPLTLSTSISPPGVSTENMMMELRSSADLLLELASKISRKNAVLLAACKLRALLSKSSSSRFVQMLLPLSTDFISLAIQVCTNTIYLTLISVVASPKSLK